MLVGCLEDSLNYFSSSFSVLELCLFGLRPHVFFLLFLSVVLVSNVSFNKVFIQ